MTGVCFNYLPWGLGKSTVCYRRQPVPDRRHFPPLRGSRFVGSAGTETTKGRQVKIFLIQDCGAIPWEPDKRELCSADLGEGVGAVRVREWCTDPPDYSPYPWNNKLSLTLYFNLSATA